MQWFYLDASQRQVPVEEADLPAVLGSGTITGDTLFWNETMGDWQSAAELFPDWFPTEPTPMENAAPVVSRPAPLLAAAKGPSIGLVKRPVKTLRGGDETGEDESPEAPAEVVRDLASFLGARSGWMKFLGVMLIIIGVIYCLTLVGALVGWLPIWMGVVIMKAAESARSAQYRGHQLDLEDALDRVAVFLKLQGVFLLVSLIFWSILTGLIVVSGMVATMSVPGLTPTE